MLSTKKYYNLLTLYQLIQKGIRLGNTQMLCLKAVFSTVVCIFIQVNDLW